MTGLEQAQGSLKYDLVYLNYSFVSDRSQWAPVADLEAPFESFCLRAQAC